MANEKLMAKLAAKAEEREAKYRAKYDIPDHAFVAIGHVGYASFDGHFITLQRVGMGRGITGKGVKRIPLQSVTAVQVKPGGAVMSGFIQFTIPGGNEVRSQFGSQTVDAVNDENSMIFTRQDEAPFLILRDKIEQALVSHHAPAAPVAAAPDVMGQLQQLGQLRDAGVVTAEEFEAKKAELLNRL
ncbi:DUF4429 domain-containing protein [Arthrobacter sp. GMC3]|uniref:DUF4429 domain-containing protein n=1 Tax=Arthrobacter sp. GMC3 TaxID=2058894 RepID=UPI000CE52511|nr:DUF4429 domain-containing protein [Arthrobacter sp. GMC3]